MSQKKPVTVLVVDDSAVMRDLLVKGLSLDRDLRVIGKASDVYSARDRIVQLRPDVMTLDIQMPGMDGIEFLKRLMPQYPLPVIVVSALTPAGSRQAMDALEAGALEVVAKPAANNPNGLAEMIAELAAKIKEAALVNVAKLHKPPAQRAAAMPQAELTDLAKHLVVIGASTGGTIALTQIISALPAKFPPVVIVQHMPAVFTKMFADSLARVSQLAVVEATDRLPLRPGLVVVAAGDFHASVVKLKGQWIIRCTTGPLVSGHRPSVDVLFQSVALSAGDRAIGVLLTGMGRDGADGLLAMRAAGARCLAQDENSSVVFGMPKAAWDNGGAERLVSLEHIAPTLVTMLATSQTKGVQS